MHANQNTCTKIKIIIFVLIHVFMINICEKKKSKKKTCIIVYMNYYMYVYTCIQLCSDSILMTYIHSIINNKLGLIESLFTTELYLIFITVVIPTLSLSPQYTNSTKQNLNKYNIYIYKKNTLKC